LEFFCCWKKRSWGSSFVGASNLLPKICLGIIELEEREVELEEVVVEL